MTALERSVLRFPRATRERLDDLAATVGNLLNREVPRAAVVRAAVQAWLAMSERDDLAKVAEAIRVSIVKRGRKARSATCKRTVRRAAKR